MGVSSVTCMSYMFSGASSFNQDVSEWDVSNVTLMSYMFSGTSSFNQDVSEWGVSNVACMSHMFSGASSFNQDVSGWDVSKVANMSHMFYGASSFNQDVSGWDVSSNTNVFHMFVGAVILVECLNEAVGVDSYFQGAYQGMVRSERKWHFTTAFRWQRRKALMIFLVSQRYVASAEFEHQSGVTIGEGMKCDCVLEVEDLTRYICKFL